MRYSLLAGMLALTTLSTRARAQQVGPNPTNPLDTNAGTIPGTNVPTGIPTTGPVQTTPPPAVSPPVITPAVPTTPIAPIGTPITIPRRPGQQPAANVAVPPNANPNAVTPNVPPPTVGADTTPDPLRIVPGGLTADAAAERALRSAGPTLQIARANLEISRAAAQEAARAMIPQLSTSFRYTRLSWYTVPPVSIAGFTFTLVNPILDQMDWQTTLTIPLSDIPLRILPMYQAANLQIAGAELNLESTRAQTGLEAREAFYEYVRALGQEFLINQSIVALQRRLADIVRAVQAGTVARAQQMAFEAQIADLQRTMVLAHMPVVINETLVRQRLHMRPDEQIVIGENLDGAPPLPASITDLINRAQSTRPEVNALERQIEAVDRQITSTRASQFPSVAAVAHADYLNPNTRLFPQTPTWGATWDATIQVSWNATQAFTADATISRLRAQQALLAAQQTQLREGIEVQVRQYFLQAQTAQAQVQSTAVQLASAQENLRVTRERVAAGAAVAAELAQAETDLLRARLNAINAVIDARLAVARIRRATGEREPSDTHP